MAEALRIGVLNDLSDGPPGPETEQWLRIAADDLIAKGRLDRELEFIHGWGHGLPSGTAAKVERAFIELVEQDVLMIVGPAVGDNALVATPLAERFSIPTLNWAGSERARGDYMFHLQVGSHEDESIVIARHLAAIGTTRIGVVYDRSPIGRRHLTFLQAEAEIIGLDIVAVQSVGPLAVDAEAQVRMLIDARADAIVYLGLGLSAPAVARALTARDWQGPRIMNTAGIRGYQAEHGRIIDGWMYIDMHADDNLTLNAVCDRLDLGQPMRLTAAKGYDLGCLVGEGLARAAEYTREGIKDGLEQIKWLPAAEGHEGTLLGFGKQDRGALHGRYLVVRKWCEGQSLQVETP